MCWGRATVSALTLKSCSDMRLTVFSQTILPPGVPEEEVRRLLSVLVVRPTRFNLEIRMGKMTPDINPKLTINPEPQPDCVVWAK